MSYEYDDFQTSSPAIEAQTAMRIALEPAPASQQEYQSDQQWMDHPAPAERLPRFPSGVGKLDQALLGGFYGVSVVAAPKGVGKTMIAFRAASVSPRRR